MNSRELILNEIKGGVHRDEPKKSSPLTFSGGKFEEYERLIDKQTQWVKNNKFHWDRSVSKAPVVQYRFFFTFSMKDTSSSQEHNKIRGRMKQYLKSVNKLKSNVKGEMIIHNKIEICWLLLRLIFSCC